MKNFVLIGAAGYVAPRHMEAIKAIGGNLVAILDPHDALGIVDRYFPEARYFSEFERFDRFCERFTSKEKIHYVSIATPNYLHSSNCLFALRIGADAICEKPVVLKSRNLDQLREAEAKYGGKVWCIMQARLHDHFKNFFENPEMFEARKAIIFGNSNEFSTMEINYVAPRGAWYHESWKGNQAKSGGIIFNLGVHLFDIVGCYFMGMPDFVDFSLIGPQAVSGTLHYSSFTGIVPGIVKFNLSTSGEAQRTFRVFLGNHPEPFNLDLSKGFELLHIKSYQEIVEKNNGLRLNDAEKAIKICEYITDHMR